MYSRDKPVYDQYGNVVQQGYGQPQYYPPQQAQQGAYAAQPMYAQPQQVYVHTDSSAFAAQNAGNHAQVVQAIKPAQEAPKG